jgi:hypothetical protein
MITQERLQELVEYKEGTLIWKDSRNGNVTIGATAGGINNKGYNKITLEGTLYSVHRMIFLYHHGWLPRYVDHRDRNKLNNNIDNLRPATHAQNRVNSNSNKGSKSKHKGVYWRNDSKKWQVQIRHNKKIISVGHYLDEEEAAEAYNLKIVELHGDFAVLNTIDNEVINGN